MNRPDLDAIEGADHMNSPEADKHDGDGWYRYTIRDLIAYARDLKAKVERRNKQISQLMDRISELETALEPFVEALEKWESPHGATRLVAPDYYVRLENFQVAHGVLRKGAQHGE